MRLCNMATHSFNVLLENPPICLTIDLNCNNRLKHLRHQLVEELRDNGLTLPPNKEPQVFKAPLGMACPRDSLDENEISRLIKTFDPETAGKLTSLTQSVDEWFPPASVVKGSVHIIVLHSSGMTHAQSTNYQRFTQFPSLAKRIEQNAILAVARTLKSHDLEHITADILTIYTKATGNWDADDVRDPRNRITLLWEDNNESAAKTALEAVQSELDQNRMISTVRMCTYLPLFPFPNTA